MLVRLHEKHSFSLIIASSPELSLLLFIACENGLIANEKAKSESSLSVTIFTHLVSLSVFYIINNK